MAFLKMAHFVPGTKCMFNFAQRVCHKPSFAQTASISYDFFVGGLMLHSVLTVAPCCVSCAYICT